MKNHIALKFIAVVLCAASLLAAVGSGLGIFALSESGLYEKTVAELYQERIESQGSYFAERIGTCYASMALGGFTESMLRDRYVYLWTDRSFDPLYYGYKLKDAEGNVLKEYAITNDSPDAVTYKFPVSGEYMYIQSIIPESEKYPEAEPEQTWVDGETYFYDGIPHDGVGVSQITVTYADGSSEGMGSDEDIGYLTYTDEGYVQFEAFHPEIFDVEEGTVSPVTHISFTDINGEILFEAGSPGVVGYIFNEGGQIFIRTTILSAAADSVEVPETWDAIDPAAVTEALSEPVFARVSADAAEIYETPSLDGYFTHRLLSGFSVQVLQQEIIDGVDWSFITTASNVEGWTLTQWLTIPSTDDAPAEATTPAEIPSEAMGGYINAYVNVYTSPSLSSPVVGYLNVGNTVDILTRETVNNEEWGWVANAGWIMLDQVTLSPAVDPSPYAADGETAGTTEPTAANDGIALASETEEAAAVSTDPTLAKEAVPEATVAETVSETAAAAEIAATVPEAPTAPDAPTAPEISAAPETEAVETEPAETFEIIITDDSIHTMTYWDAEVQETMYVEYSYAQMPEYTVELTLAPGALRYSAYYSILEQVWCYRNELFIILGVSVLLFAILAVYLCCAAGRKPGSTEVRAAGLNCIPLDAYLCGGILGIGCLCIVLVEGGDYLLRQNILVGCVFMVGMAYLACLVFVAFCFACAAQFKTPGGYWWRSSVFGRCMRGVAILWNWFIDFCADKLFPFTRKAFGWLCRVTLALLLFGKRVVIALYGIAGKVWCRFWALAKNWTGKLWKALGRFLSLIPLTWQWLLVGVFMIMLILATDASIWAFVIDLFILLYGTHCFGTLMESARRMSKGDLDTKVDDKLLIGCFRDFSGDLNDLADVAVVAAQKQLKSERMKTELITNVSHDIKTPLTSIINYVDLLQKPHTDKEQEQYLEVLDRQSQRLKKLIDDLMEMSKANTGNMTVDITKVDAVESVNQALGEFADKLDKAQLIPVFRRPEETVVMMADGRLVWRVLSNLLSNAVKYALPGTRLYIDLMELEGKVIISLKNISREELNVDADELMERFVRGDDSRNTEGSGLGLNIAKSLMELQKGQLQLLVDGDLFKVTLIFPGA